MTRKNMPRRGKQFKVGEEFRIAIHMAIKNFRHSEDQKEYAFPSSLTSNERGYVHNYCSQFGLKTKSRGEGANRFLTVYKKEGSTIVQADAVFELGNASRRHTINLLHRFPITARERQELLPPTERDRILGQETVREVNRYMGKLSTGIPMVPPRRCENECTLFRQSLPIWNSREEIIQMISCHQTVLISGETGSGKTTQVPQYILEQSSALGQPCRIICTEPRRIAALTIAERVALERDEKVGHTVGYQVRLESRISPKTLLTFCTTGVLLRTLMGGDASIATVTHIIVDELHERDRLSDFLLIVLRDLLLKFRNLKVILMSASLDTQLFSKYFSNCPIIEVPGRVYDVKTFFLEDILKGTGYRNEAMMKYKNDFVKHKSSKLDSWCSLQVASDSSPGSASNISHPAPEIDLNLENLSLNSADDDSERVELDPHLAAAMDKAIEDIWMSGSDDFTNLIQLLVSENISVDYQHNETNVSPLMLAAGRGNIDVVDQFLSLGASLHLKSTNGWTAVEWANHFGHKDVEELLAGQCDYDYAQDGAKADEQADMSDEEKLVLDAYTLSIDEDKIDHNLILYLLERICASQEEGAVLVFLPGYDDIIILKEKILNESESIPERGVSVFTLHSQMQSADQKRVFRPVPSGIRKIVLSTNIAETSITINDVVFVIDCGKVKEKTFDALTGASQLKAGWISKASAIQRRGRAGRCRPGICYHIYSKARFNSFQKFQVPEILRVPIYELCLQAKLLAPPNAPIADFLAKAPDPPPFMVTRNAVTLLKTIDALDPWEELTELGLHLLDLPIEPRLGKMVLYAVMLKCLDPVLTIACCLAYRDPFLLPSQPAQRRAVSTIRREFASDTFSDHMVLLRTFQAWQKAKSEGYERSFCQKHFLSPAVLEMIAGMRSQLLGQLRASGFVKVRGSGDVRDLNMNSDTWAVVKAALCAGTYPNLIRIDRDRQQLITQKESKVRFHHTSVLNNIGLTSKRCSQALRKKTIGDLPSDWLLYEEMMRTGSTAHAHCCTLITPITVALFAGPARLPLDALHEPDQGYIEDEDSGDDSKYDNQKAMFKIDDWISFRVEPEMARLVLQLRQKWHALFLKRMHGPSKPLTQADESVIRSIVSVLLAEDIALHLLQPAGIGQRPRPIEHFSLADIGLPSSPSHRNSNPPNFYNASQGDIFNPNGEQSHFSGSFMGASNFNPSRSSSSPIPGPLAPSYTGVQQMNSPHGTHYRIAYFIIKANTSRAVEISMAKNIFAFTPITERKLVSAVNEGKNVILIFSIQGSGHFQGYARFTTRLSELRPPEFCQPNLGSCYQIVWVKKAYIPFQSTRHLTNAWNENRKVQTSRDGQELEPTVGESLCQLIIEAQMTESMKGNRRQMNYGQRDNFQSDSSPVNGNQWTMLHHGHGSGPWMDQRKYWSQSDD